MDRCLKFNRNTGARTWGEAGFTMVELLVSIGILTVVMAFTFSFLWGASNYWHKGQSNADITENARMGLNRMTRELKQATNVITASPSEVTFTVNFGTGAETVTYGFAPGSGGAPGTIWRSSTAGPQNLTMVNDVNSVQFDYYGNDYRCDTIPIDGVVTWSELQACGVDPVTHVARVDINMTLSTGSSAPQSFAGQAWLRNRNTTGA